MRKFLLGLLATVVLIAAAIWWFSDSDIPRATLEAKYATSPSQFVIVDYFSTQPSPDATPGTPTAMLTRVHYRERGPKDAPALLLLHGSNASLFTWEPWSKILSDQYRVISVDLPGHGLTGAVPSQDYSDEGMARFVKNFADKLGLQKFAIAGNSMGGAVAARFAEDNPNRVTRLILVDAGGMPFKPGDKEPLAFQLARTPMIRDVMLYVTPRSIVTEGLNDAIVRKAIINDRMVDEYWEFARMDGTREATLERFSLPDDTYVKDHVSALKMPTLILWGDQDHLIPVETAHDFARAIPGSKLIVYQGTGHIPQEEVAVRSAADARTFLSTVP